MSSERSPLLTKLVKQLESLKDKFDENEHAGFMVISAQYNPEDDPGQKGQGLYTFIGGGGNPTIMAEALYAELRAQIESGDRSLFYILTEVLQDLMDDLSIGPDPEPDENVGPTLH